MKKLVTACSILSLFYCIVINSSQNSVPSLLELSKKSSFSKIKKLIENDQTSACKEFQKLPSNMVGECIHFCCRQGFDAPQALSDCIKESLKTNALTPEMDYYKTIADRLSVMKIVDLAVFAGHGVSSRNQWFISVLIANGMIHPDFTFSDGQTLLHRATQLDDEALVIILLQLKCSVNARDTSKYTALHFASSLKVAQLLVSAGADIRAQGDVRKDIPWQSASLAGRNDVADYLKGLLV